MTDEIAVPSDGEVTVRFSNGIAVTVSGNLLMIELAGATEAKVRQPRRQRKPPDTVVTIDDPFPFKDYSWYRRVDIEKRLNVYRGWTSVQYNRYDLPGKIVDGKALHKGSDLNDYLAAHPDRVRKRRPDDFDEE